MSLIPKHEGYLVFEGEQRGTAGPRQYCDFESLCCMMTVYEAADKASIYSTLVCCTHMHELPCSWPMQKVMKKRMQVTGVIDSTYTRGLQYFELLLAEASAPVVLCAGMFDFRNSAREVEAQVNIQCLHCSQFDR